MGVQILVAEEAVGAGGEESVGGGFGIYGGEVEDGDVDDLGDSVRIAWIGSDFAGPGADGGIGADGFEFYGEADVEPFDRVDARSLGGRQGKEGAQHGVLWV